MNKSKLAIGLFVAGTLTAVFGLVILFVGPIFIDDQIVKNLVIDPENEVSYTMWKDIPVPFFMSVYFFNILNPTEFLAGENPMVEQRGPYVYRKRLQKQNITFHPNHTVSYLEYRSYFFEPSMSVGNESDVVTIPNMLVLGAAVMMENMPHAVRLLLSATFKSFKEGPFLSKSVGELMWGYDSKLVDFLNKWFPGMLPSTGKFGLFSEFNNSNTGMFTVHTGKDDIRLIHKVNSWNGLTELIYWKTPQCNMINGTAGQMWPPFMTKESTLPFYSPDACRSLELVYQREGIMKGIPLYRFVAPKTMFANGSDYAPNEGFCPCRQSGLLNVSSCRSNAPVFISQPHFYNADPVLLDYVQGLQPTEDEHGLFIDIHPETGVPLNVSIRLQLNLYMKKVSGITETGKISEVVMPMIWFEENGYMDGAIVKTFHTNLVLLPMVMVYMQYCFLGLGLATVLGAVLLHYSGKIIKCERTVIPDASVSTSSSEQTPLIQDHVD
ncbi:scavenger receptor class B member 1-like isoform X2 [Oncorhynchus nerka]|uniref:scavenger receptor class B member 1-like isoform X2 n=1 Tax=Oncorhynchus nerka TaxID=8023 RepID=UPI001131508F|nr:scavenger receptor class B member 1-like isoform X2 [Oncorhynchus nerka]XP_029476096.1 scavenger receptor class B member 1-like isoform X2 [Oncorhynchus nerka]